MLSSLRAKLTLSSLAVSLLILALFFVVSYVLLGQFLEATARDTTRLNVRIALDNVDRDVDALRQLLSWISVSDEVQEFLTAPPGEPESSERRTKLAAYAALRVALYGNPLYGRLHKLIVLDPRGRSIQLGSTPGHQTDAERARRAALQDGDHLVVEPYEYGTHLPVIMVSRRIHSPMGDTVGWIVAAVDTEEVSQYLSNYTYLDGVQTYLVVGSDLVAIDPELRKFRDAPVPSSSFPLSETQVQRRWGNLDQTLVVETGEHSGWRIAQTVILAPKWELNHLFFVLSAFVVFALALLVAAVLVLVDRNIHRPIGRIQRRLALVAQGDFRSDPSIEFATELGDIGRGINQLCRDMEGLIANRLRDAAAQKDLEFKMLQNQIRPHFLYNTLNSLKWMAEIQGSDGIAEMAGALATLLKHVAKGTDEMVPLAEELHLVDQYCLIQSFRTGGMATLKVFVDEGLETTPVFKFTLQPLVENAYHHGIEPSGHPGTIVIHCHVQDVALVIDVTDDGVGIPPERLMTLLTDPGSPDVRGFQAIGLRNVDERIRLRFGPEFGLSFASEPGAFTRVTVRLPRSPACIVS